MEERGIILEGGGGGRGGRRGRVSSRGGVVVESTFTLVAKVSEEEREREGKRGC